MQQTCLFGAGSDYIPNHVLRDASAPYLSCPGYCSKDFACLNARRSYPEVERCLCPVRDGHSPDVAILSDQIHNRPMPLTHLDIVELQPDQFGSTQTTTEQDRQHRVVSLSAKGGAVSTL